MLISSFGEVEGVGHHAQARGLLQLDQKGVVHAPKGSEMSVGQLTCR
jgi:hypothetical protein